MCLDIGTQVGEEIAASKGGLIDHKQESTNKIKIRLKYVQAFYDGYGKLRCYFRRSGFKRIALPGQPYSAEFMDTYRAALAGEVLEKWDIDIQPKRVVSGSIREAVLDLYKSTLFRTLAPNTQCLIKSELERFCAQEDGRGGRYGDYPRRLLKYKHIDAILGTKAETPGACHNFLRALRKLVKYCIRAELLTEDPTRDIELPKLNPNGRRAWSDEHIAIYEKRWPIGSKERLALALALYLALRREDLILIGPQYIFDGVLHICPQKTRNSTGVVLDIPIPS
jgi:hypothetical protein